MKAAVFGRYGDKMAIDHIMYSPMLISIKEFTKIIFRFLSKIDIKRDIM